MPICAPLQQMFLSVGIPPPAVLANASITATGSSTANVSIDTDTAGGTMYFVVSPTANIDGTLTAAQIVAGQDIAGAATYASSYTPVSGSNGSGASLLSPSTAYLVAYVQHTASGYSNVKIAVASATTSAARGAAIESFKLGAGGQITNISMTSDGTKIARNDTYGIYLFNASGVNPGNAGGTGVWQQIVTKQSMPDSVIGISAGTWDGDPSGTYEAVIAPSNTQRFYQYSYNHVLRTDNQGVSWSNTNFASIPATGNDPTKFFGPYIAVDPNNADIVVVGSPCGGCRYSLDAGASWAQITTVAAAIPAQSSQILGTSLTSHSVATGTNISFTTSVSFNLSIGQEVRAYQTSNPANQLVGVVGTSGDTGTALFMTVTSVYGSGTVSDWSFYLPIQSNGAGTQAGGHLVAFDGSSTVYISTYGIGVFKSTTGPSGTFTLTTSTPTTHQHIWVDQGHNLWLVDNATFQSGVLHKFNGSTWSTITAAGTGLSCIAVDPANVLNVTAGNSGGGFNISKDGGGTWTGLPGSTGRTATDIPWLAVNEAFMTTGNMVYDPDPSAPNTIYLAEGIGVWKANPPASGNATNWTSVSAGIEQLVSVDVIGPPGGAPIFGVLDRGVFKGVSPLYPSNYGPNYTRNLIDGWCVEYCSSAPGTVVGLTYDGDGLGAGGGWQGSISTNGGDTWSVFAAQPGSGTGQNGGMIAASTPSNIIYCGANFGTPYYTINGGTSWTKVSIAGISDGDGYSSFASFLNRKTIAADRVTANTFYLYNTGTGAPGLYKSGNSGATWAKVKATLDGVANTGLFYPGEVSANARLKSVPGNAGHLFYTPGIQVGATHPTSVGFFRCTDAGPSWTTVANFTDVWDFGFGVARPGGGGYPAIYVYGWFNGVLGVWRSDDSASTWVSISDGFPAGSISQVRCVYGDGVTYGTCYIGTGGQGFFQIPLTLP